ncbi:hypothetical protein K470DRAFT_197936, partial [Piedraia hortae CBS 480.64]
SCAICGAPANCHHESEALAVAIAQAQARWWSKISTITDWVFTHAQNEVNAMYQDYSSSRLRQYRSHVESIPYYQMFVQHHGNPPLHPMDLGHIHAEMDRAAAIYKEGIDRDWRECVQKYPHVLDKWYQRVEV